MNPIGRRLCSIALLLTLVLQVLALIGPRTEAQGGVVIQPYWAFEAEARVNVVRAADINGDDSLEVILGTADNWLYLLGADGHLIWSYEASSPLASLLASDLDADGRAEIVAGLTDGTVSMLQPGRGTVWTYATEGVVNALVPADLDGDGRREILVASHDGQVRALTAEGRLVWYYDIGRAVQGLSAADLDGDGLPEVIPSPLRGSQIWVLEADGRLAWQAQTESEVGLVDSGDVDGDGQAEVVLFSAAWEITALAGDGQKLWRDDGIAHSYAHDHPRPGQMSLADLNGDGHMEVVAISLSPGLVHVLQGDGRLLWQHTFGPIAYAASLYAGDVNGDGRAKVLVAANVSDPVRLLNADGELVAEYRTKGASGALECADLNGDGWDEVLVGTTSGLLAFGTSDKVTTARIWETRLGSPPVALELGDVDGDGTGEVAAGTQDGRIVALTYDNRVLVDVAVGAPVVDLALGDVDGDGRDEVVVGTWGGPASRGEGLLQLIAAGKRAWSAPAGAYVTDVAVRDLMGDGQAEIIAAFGLAAGGSAVALFDERGSLLWQQDIAEQVTAVGNDDSYLLAATASGRIHRLTGDGKPQGYLDLGRPIIALDGTLAVTTDGQLYQLTIPSLERAAIIHSAVGHIDAATIGKSNVVIATAEGQISQIAVSTIASPMESRKGSVVWETTLGEQVTGLSLGDLNGDGQVELAVGTRRGHVTLFGQILNQPPLLTNPAYIEVGSGYSYSVNANDPDREAVRVTLEIWDPSRRTWHADRELTLENGVGLLNWSVPDAFDTWDAGRDSKFRFIYNDGHTQATAIETAGPFAISTAPWYVYYGSRAGLVALILAILGLGLVFYRRQQVYRSSPVGRAEALLRGLRANPAEALPKLHAVSRDAPALLAHLPGLASQAGEATIAELSEGFHLILSRPEVASEGLRAVVEAIEANGLGEPVSAIVRLYALCLRALEVNTVSGIVALLPQLGSPGEALAHPNTMLAPATAALVDLGRMAQTLRNYELVETVEDKVAYLAQAIETLGRLDREYQTNVSQPERTLLVRIVSNWLAVVTNAIQDLQGRAQLEVSLKTRQILTLDQATLSLELMNTGRSPASNVAVTLVPSQEYTVVDGIADLDILPVGRRALVELSIAELPAAGHFRAEFAITYDDREQSGKTMVFADRVRLLKPAATFRPLPNPYAPGTPLLPGSSIFFGRDDLFRFIAENMAGLARQNILVLIGQRRMGKTSFLRQLPVRLGKEYLPVYIDGQSLGIDPGMAHFFYDLALAIVDALADQGLEVEDPEPEDFSERPSGTFERTFLPAVFEVIGQRQLLLLFDEFEELEMRMASGKLEPTIFPFFRHLMQHGRQLGFIFVGTHRLEALSADYWSIFFNIALYKHVTFLSEAAAKDLIAQPVVEHGLLYDSLAIDKILRVTAGHPYFLQLTCHTLVNHANRERRGYVTIQDVNDVLGEMIELGEAHFAFLWQQSSPLEQLVLASLTRLLGQEPTVTAAQVTGLLEERGVTLGMREARAALRRLVERDIVRETFGQSPKYEYKIELVRLWVERYKALGQVIEESV